MRLKVEMEGCLQPAVMSREGDRPTSSARKHQFSVFLSGRRGGDSAILASAHLPFVPPPLSAEEGVSVWVCVGGWRGDVCVWGGEFDLSPPSD